MPKFQLTCCSTADMPYSYFEDNKIPFVCFHFIMDGQEYPDDLGKSMNIEEFYKRISNGSTPTTSQVNVGEYIDFFEPILKNGEDILHITLSSGISGTYNSALIARETLLNKYPERNLYIVDSLGASSGYGLLVDAACKLRDQDKSLDETYDWLENNKLRVHHWFFSTDLTSFYRGGRISKSSAVIGSILEICPILSVNFEGKLMPQKKYRTKNRVIKEMIKRMEDFADDRLNYSGKCYLSHSACYDDARKVADLIESEFKNLDGKVTINNIGTVIGSHTGPGTVALFFFGDKRKA